MYFQIDKQLASGEYFLNKEQKRVKQKQEKDEKHAEAAKRRAEKRQEVFIAPEEPGPSKRQALSLPTVDVAALKEKIMKLKAKNKKKAL